MPDEAAYAPNWWRILLIDAGIGVALVVVGAWLATTWNPVAWVLVPLGVYYEYLVVKRIARWRAIRSGRRPLDPG